MQSIRWKMFGAFVGSLVLALASTFLLAITAIWLSKIGLFPAILSMIIGAIGSVPIAVMTGAFFFVVYFFLLTHQTVRYIEALNAAVHDMARGNLSAPLPPGRTDELGRLSENLAIMARQLKASREEERRAEQAKYELITSVSHDLRTPLTAMLGYLDLAEHDRYRDEVELRHYVGIAYGKCLQLKRMIDQLFEFTRTSHGALRLRAVPVNMAELLEQLAEEFVPQLRAAQMEYRLVIPPERIAAMVDPDLMVRVLQNLMANAIRYGKSGRQVDLELQQQGGRVIVRVANYGEPIPEWELPRIFDKFYRVEKSRSERTGGAGLGLAIARNIVELHGGTIGAYNEAGRTVFEVQVPAGPALHATG